MHFEPLTISWLCSAALITLTATAHAGSYLVIHGDTVYDMKTNLTWQRCSQGLRWNPATKHCVGVKKAMTFDEAISGWSNSGRREWRMPTIDELKTLVEKKGADGLHIDSQAFPDTRDGDLAVYWSGTERRRSYGVCVSFNDGYAYENGRKFTGAVRLVLGGR